VSYGWLDLGERDPSAGARRGFLGVVPDFSTEADEGVVIAGTVPGSPAEKAGLLEDDVILEIDRRPVHNLQALADILRDLTPGDEVEIVYRRAGVERRTRARIVERNEEGA
jgi:S1-C subfamily serine protease